jgi:hypothetical protein
MIVAIATIGTVLALLAGRQVTLARIRAQERRYIAGGIRQLEGWLSHGAQGSPGSRGSL